MSKKKNKRSGGASPLTHLIRLLILAIFVVAVVIAFYRIAEVMQNNEKKEELQSNQVKEEIFEKVSYTF